MKAVELAKVWLDAVKGKAYQPNPEEINHFRKLVKFPIGDVEFADFQATQNEDDEEIETNQPGMEAGSVLPANGQKVSDTALNGAQVTALVEVVKAVANGTLPRESAVALIESAFLVDKAEAEKILGSAGNGFVPRDLLSEQETNGNVNGANQKETSQRRNEEKKANGDEPRGEKPAAKGFGDKKSNFAKAYNFPEGDYHKKVNFNLLSCPFLTEFRQKMWLFFLGKWLLFLKQRFQLYEFSL